MISKRISARVRIIWVYGAYSVCPLYCKLVTAQLISSIYPVKTGKYQQGDEQREGVLPPNEVHDSFTTFVENLLQDRL